LSRLNSDPCLNQQHSGSFDYKEMAWNVSVENGIAYPPVVVGQFVILIDRKDNKVRSPDSDVVYAFERSSGRYLWRYPSDSTTGYIDTIKGSSNYLILNIRNNSQSNQVVILDLINGQPVFAISDTAVDVAISNDVIVYQDLIRAIHVYELSTQSLLWETAGTNARSNRGLYIQENDLYTIIKMEAFRFDLRTGAILSRISPHTQTGQNLNAIAAALIEKKVLLASGRRLTYLDVDTDLEYWSVPIVDDSKLRPEIWQPAFDDNQFYIIVDSYRLLAVSKDDGAIEWEKQPGGLEKYVAPSAFHNGMIYVMWSDGSIHQFDIVTTNETGVLIGPAPRGMINREPYWYYPGLTANDDLLFVTFGCETLYAFRESSQ